MLIFWLIELLFLLFFPLVLGVPSFTLLNIPQCCYLGGYKLH